MSIYKPRHARGYQELGTGLEQTLPRSLPRGGVLLAP